MPNTATKQHDKQVTALRKKIADITGRQPVSDDPRYLAQRLAFYEKQKEAGVNVRRKKSGTTVISVSMPAAGGAAFEKILLREKVGASELGRRALAEWATNNGYVAEAAAIRAE